MVGCGWSSLSESSNAGHSPLDLSMHAPLDLSMHSSTSCPHHAHAYTRHPSTQFHCTCRHRSPKTSWRLFTHKLTLMPYPPPP